jgi:hypothetical protein
MHTLDGDRLASGDRVLVRGTYLGAHPLPGWALVQVLGRSYVALPVDVPIEAVSLPERPEPAWRAVSRPMGITPEAHYVGLYRRTNTGDWHLSYTWGGPDDDALDGVCSLLGLVGVPVTRRADIREVDHQPWPEWLYGDDMEARA